MVRELLQSLTDLAFRSYAAALDTPLAECKYAVIDTELTGLDPKEDSIVSVGGIKMTGARIELGNTFYKVVSPRTALRRESVVIHGIMPSETEDKPLIDDVIPEFKEFCGDAVIVGHFVSLDLMFLNKEVKRLQTTPFQNPVVDTVSVYDWLKQHNGDFSRHFNVGNGNKDLFTVAKKYNIKSAGGHNALMDAFVAAQLFQRFLNLLPSFGVRELRHLLRIGKP